MPKELKPSEVKEGRVEFEIDGYTVVMTPKNGHPEITARKFFPGTHEPSRSEYARMYEISGAIFKTQEEKKQKNKSAETIVQMDFMFV